MVRLVHIHFMNLGTTYHMTTPLDFAREIIGRPGTVFGLNDIFEHKGCLPNLEGILKNRCKVDRSAFESLFSEFAMIYVRGESKSGPRKMDRLQTTYTSRLVSYRLSAIAMWCRPNLHHTGLCITPTYRNAHSRSAQSSFDSPSPSGST